MQIPVVTIMMLIINCNKKLYKQNLTLKILFESQLPLLLLIILVPSPLAILATLS